MKFEKLQYITDSPQQAEEACLAGVRWVQGRVKKKSPEETRIILSQISTVCRKYGVMFIVNDFLEIALELNADGVHLGKNDLDIAAAKKIIGSKKMILGGTANTTEDVIRLSGLHVDYIGLGPLRFTSTKEQLSPVLGFEGYHRILEAAHGKTFNLPPVFAIGGVLPQDIQALFQAGVYGAAVSGVISFASSKSEMVAEFNHQFSLTTHVN